MNFLNTRRGGGFLPLSLRCNARRARGRACKYGKIHAPKKPPGSRGQNSAMVSIIIVSHNSGTLLLECVQSVLGSTHAVEVIVSDNGSVDCSIEALEALARREPRLTVLRNGANLGFGRGNNAALSRVRGEYVLFLNPDCIVGEDTLTRMVAFLERHPRAGMAGCLIRNPDGTEQAGCRRQVPTPRRALTRMWSPHRQDDRRPPGGPAAAPLPESPVAVEAISGAFMLVRTAVLQQVGSFDEAYFMHWEDLDLCLRFRQAGWEVLFVPAVEIVHFKGRSSSQRPFFVEWHKHLGLIRFFRKFYFNAYPLWLYSFVALAILCHFAVRAALLKMRSGNDVDFDEPRMFLGSCEKEAWVFGASSLVGRCLLPRLVAAGYCVRAFSRDPAAGKAVDSTRLKWHRFDLDAATALPEVGRPDVVLHLAPLWLLPAHLEALAARGMKQLIAFGSTSRFTKRDSSNPKERRLVAAFETAEREIEDNCTRLGTRWAIFRPTLIYSLGYDRNISVLASFIRRFRFFPLPGSGSGLRQPVHADDLAAACTDLLRTPGGWNQAYNLSGGQVLRYRAMVEAIFAKLGLRACVVCFSRAWWRPLLALARLMPAYRGITMEIIGRVNIDMCFDHDEATRNFGFSARKFEP